MKRGPKLRLDQYLSGLLFLAAIWLAGSFEPQIIEQAIARQTTPVYQVETAPLPSTSSSFNALLAPPVTATSAAVIDLESGSLLYQKNWTKPLLPASTMKLLTALVVRQTYDLDQVLTVSEELVADGSNVGFYAGEQLTVHDLLKAMLIQSENDAAQLLAESHPQGYEAFVAGMNRQAQELNLIQTKAINPIGFDHPDQQSSMRDLLILSKAVLEDDVLAAIVKQRSAILTDQNQVRQHYVGQTHRLMWNDPTVYGIKTGTTEGAREVLLTYTVVDGKHLLIGVMGSTDRYQETLALRDWVMAQYQWLPISAIL